MTIVDFYHGSYGNTIRIDVQDRTWLSLLKDQIALLAGKSIPTLDLLLMKGVVKDEISGLILKLGTEPVLTMTATTQSEKYASFIWIANEENIAYIRSAIDQLLQIDKPGHYYLYDDDDFLLELAYME